MSPINQSSFATTMQIMKTQCTANSELVAYTAAALFILFLLWLTKVGSYPKSK